MSISWDSLSWDSWLGPPEPRTDKGMIDDLLERSDPRIHGSDRGTGLLCAPDTDTEEHRLAAREATVLWRDRHVAWSGQGTGFRPAAAFWDSDWVSPTGSFRSKFHWEILFQASNDKLHREDLMFWTKELT